MACLRACWPRYTQLIFHPNIHTCIEEPHAAEPGAKPHWTYGDQSSWGSEFPECTGLKLRQSPIDIETNKVIHKNMSIEFINWDQDVDLDLKNTHHSISVIPQSPDDKKPSVVLSWLPDGLVFELQEMHFHWGDGVKKGSEHEINNDRAAAEVSSSSWSCLNGKLSHQPVHY